MTEIDEHKTLRPTKKERKEKFKNLSGIEIKQLYTPEDIKEFNYTMDLGEAGKFPFTRGAYPNMYRGRFWTMRQFAGFGTADQTNQRYKFLLEHGQTGLSVAFSLHTIYGIEAVDEMALGEVGKALRSKVQRQLLLFGPIAPCLLFITSRKFTLLKGS